MTPQHEQQTVLDLTLRGKFNAAVARAAQCPDELNHHNEDGMNALHLAVANQIPNHLLDALLQVDNDAVIGACQSRDSVAGMTPLMVACCVFARLEIFQALLEACPKAVSIRDHHGATCLHHLCSQTRGGFSGLRRLLARAEMLLQVDPSLARVVDVASERSDCAGSQTPLHTLCASFLAETRFDVEGLWLFIDTLLRAANYVGEPEYPARNDIERVLMIPGGPPTRLLEFACEHAPNNELHTTGLHSEKDNSRRMSTTPLHLAVQRQLYKATETLLGKYPEWAAMKDGKGNFPLHLATQSFPSFNPALFSLIAAYPKALLDVLRGDDGWLPHLLANLARNEMESGVQVDGMSVVFDILRRRGW